MNGCTNPKAKNYNPSADVDDGSCIYLEKVDGICYAFQDAELDAQIDKSYTLSFSLDGGGWVFFHDYLPDFYFSTKTQLYNLKNRSIYKHHTGNPGVFHDVAIKPFFIDAVFTADSEMILDSVQWMSEVFNDRQELEFATLTHITIWNNQQCTGRIPLDQVFDNLEYITRKTQSIWSFSSFKDMLAVYGTQFLLDIFHNFAVDDVAIDLDKPWFDQDLIHDSFFIIRLEFDNSSGKQFVLHGADINADKSYR